MKCRDRRMFALGLAVLTAGFASACERSQPEIGVAADSATRMVRALTSATPSLVTVYKTSTCPCCTEWVEHLRANGFEVEARDVSSTELAQIRSREGVAGKLASCHTSTVAGYVLEGHVPADVVRRLLDEHPQLRGLAVPGMPPGVPGMPDPGPDRPPYEVVAIQPDGGTAVYATR